MSKNKFNKMGFPEEYGLYDPKNEHENCGFGFIANIKNEPKHEIVHQALEIVHNLDHRGAVGADPLAGDGAGILIQIPDQFFRDDFASNSVNKKMTEKILSKKMTWKTTTHTSSYGTSQANLCSVVKTTEGFTVRQIPIKTALDVTPARVSKQTNKSARI